MSRPSSIYLGANFKVGENRDGYATSGSYSVHLPDGRVQTFRNIVILVAGIKINFKQFLWFKKKNISKTFLINEDSASLTAV